MWLIPDTKGQYKYAQQQQQQQQTVQIYMNGNKENHVLIFKNHLLMLWVSQQMSHWLKTAVFKNTYFFHSKNMISWLVIESLTGPLLDVSRV